MRKSTGRRHVASATDIAAIYADAERIAREEAERMAQLEKAERLAAEVAGVTVEQVDFLLTWLRTTDDGRAAMAALAALDAEGQEEAAA